MVSVMAQDEAPYGQHCGFFLGQWERDGERTRFIHGVEFILKC